MAKTYKNGLRDGKVEATIENVREDIAELKQIIVDKLWRVSANSATLGLFGVALAFLYLAIIRGWF